MTDKIKQYENKIDTLLVELDNASSATARREISGEIDYCGQEIQKLVSKKGEKNDY